MHACPPPPLCTCAPLLEHSVCSIYKYVSVPCRPVVAINNIKTHRYHNWRRGLQNYGNCSSWYATGISTRERNHQGLPRTCTIVHRSAIPEGRQCAVLLSVVGCKTYAILSNLLTPALYEEIFTALKKHFEPKRVVIAERFHFHKHEQLAGESKADYEAALRQLASHCKIGLFLEEALRDHFACGLRNESTQHRLQSEKDVTHTKAIEMAQAMETAEQNAKLLKGT